MITLYTWRTPNGCKVSIVLEELGLPYQVRPIDITRNEQSNRDFRELNPNGTIPVIVDDQGPDGKPVTVIESSAILLYLAGKGGRLLPARLRERMEALQWLMFQTGNVGPTLAQAHHFLRIAPDLIPYAMERYSKETSRLYGVLDKRLTGHEWLAGSEYSVADIATYPWIAHHNWQGQDPRKYPALRRWFERIGARPAVQRGMEIPA